MGDTILRGKKIIEGGRWLKEGGVGTLHNKGSGNRRCIESGGGRTHGEGVKEDYRELGKDIAEGHLGEEWGEGGLGKDESEKTEV